MSVSPRPTKRRRLGNEESAPQPEAKRRHPLADTGKRKRSLSAEEVAKAKYPSSNRQALTAQSLREVPNEGTEERVYRWEGRDNSRARTMSSTRSRSNRRKRSRKSASTAAGQSSLPTSVTSERTSMYDKVASDVLMDNNIYGPSYCVKPTNNQDLHAALVRARRSLSPSVYPDDRFEPFVRANHKASNEAQLASEVIHPYFTSYFEHTASTDLAFTNLEPIVPPPTTMPPPKPDHSFGSAKEDIHVTVRQALGRYIICAPGARTPAAVNDMMQVKGPDGKASVLESQITLDGAIGERAIQNLRSFARDTECPADGVARTFVQSYHAGTMKFYTTHRQPDTTGTGPDRVYTTEIAGQYLCGSPSQLRDGITKYRNSVELASRYRCEAVNAANARAAEDSSRATQPEHTSITARADSEEGSGSDGDEFYDLAE